MTLNWTELALELVVKYRQNPLRASRSLAYLHAGMYDGAVLAVRQGSSGAAIEVAIHSAAGRLLEYLYPREPPGRFEALARAALVAAVGREGLSDQAVGLAWAAGRRAADAAIRRAREDGAEGIWDPHNRPSPAPGRWVATPPLNQYDPQERLAPRWALGCRFALGSWRRRRPGSRQSEDESRRLSLRKVVPPAEAVHNFGRPQTPRCHMQERDWPRG
jgi:hypothetical protein